MSKNNVFSIYIWCIYVQIISIIIHNNQTYISVKTPVNHWRIYMLYMEDILNGLMLRKPWKDMRIFKKSKCKVLHV